MKRSPSNLKEVGHAGTKMLAKHGIPSLACYDVESTVIGYSRHGMGAGLGLAPSFSATNQTSPYHAHFVALKKSATDSDTRYCWVGIDTHAILSQFNILIH